MIKPNTISLLAITFFLATASHLPARTWTDATTKRTLEGDYISSDATNVVIKSGGKPIKIVLAERALTAAETLPDARFKEAILRERSGLLTN